MIIYNPPKNPFSQEQIYRNRKCRPHVGKPETLEQ